MKISSRKTSYSAKPNIFVARRSKLRQSCKYFPVVIAANGLLQRTADTTFPYTEDSSFWYFVGRALPGAVLVIDEHEEFLVMADRTRSQEIFDGSFEHDDIARQSGVSSVYGWRQGWAKLKSILKTSSAVSMPMPPLPYIKHYGMYTNPTKRRLLASMKRSVGSLTVHDIRQDVARLRMIKDDFEIKLLKKAVAITKDTLAEVERVGFENFHYEYQIEAEITSGFRKMGATGHGYTPIVAAGLNATTLHYVENNDSINNRSLVLIDVGAEFQHYTADITRTYSKGKPTARQLSVIDAVEGAQKDILKLFRPGALMREIEQKAEVIIGQHLFDLGLIESSRDILAVREYYPHAVSHFLGLDVHDVGDYNQSLMPGMVMTCEPGIYIPEEEIGVRIEDDVLITNDGSTVL